jgi:hypothetical protein
VFPAENIRDWRGYKVVDQRGAKIGELESIYVDTVSDQPCFAAVRVGRFGRARLVFVPLEGATVAPNHLRVAVAKADTRGAVSIGTDGELLAEAEPEVFAHYGLSYSAAANGGRRLARR